MCHTPPRHQSAVLWPPGEPQSSTHQDSPGAQGVPGRGSGVQWPSLVRRTVATALGAAVAAGSARPGAAGALLQAMPTSENHTLAWKHHRTIGRA